MSTSETSTTHVPPDAKALPKITLSIQPNGMNAYAPFDQLFDPQHGCFTKEAAERLIALRADEATQLRMSQLASGANEGTLTEEERREYETCVRAGTVLSILQAKARLMMKRQAPVSS